MFKEIFEQPQNDAGAEMPEMEKDGLIEKAEERLQELMNRALKTVEMAVINKFISKSNAEELYNFLESVNEEIAAADEKSADTKETLARLDALGELLKLPGDIKNENISKLALQKLEELERQKNSRANAAPANKNAGHRGKVSKTFYLSPRKNAQNRKSNSAGRRASL